MTCLTLVNAHLAFGHLPLLDDADFSLVEGERVGLIGRNGTGKSSLLKILAGLEQPDDGALIEQIQKAIAQKPSTHCFDTGFTAEKTMSRIGG